jgi:serine/threonine protein kinase
MSFHVGEDIGDYRIVSIIGAGSMGQVFQVEHRITKRKEAVKVLVADFATASQVQRFKREIKCQARLDHPHIARVHNALHLNGSLILVMEFVEGESLEKKLQKAKISRSTGLDYIRQTLSALEYAHEQGVVHRDVTPGNLIVDHNGNVKLTDFGVAKSLGDYQLTNAGEIVGSLYYMPPEQVRRHADPDLRSDIYAVGAVLYEILTGKKLFDCTDRLSLMVAQVQQEPIPPLDIDPGIGSELNRVVLKAVAKAPDQRYQSAREFLDALQPLAQEIPALPATPRRSYFVKTLMAAAALAVLALAFIAGPGRRSANPAPSQPSALTVVKVAPIPTIPTVSTPAPEPSAVTPVKHRHSALRQPTAEEATNAVPDGKDPMAAQEPDDAAPADATSTAPEDTSQIASEPVAADQPEASPSRKKRFWNKLNPFRRRKADPIQQNSFTHR